MNSAMQQPPTSPSSETSSRCVCQPTVTQAVTQAAREQPTVVHAAKEEDKGEKCKNNNSHHDLAASLCEDKVATFNDGGSLGSGSRSNCLFIS